MILLAILAMATPEPPMLKYDGVGDLVVEAPRQSIVAEISEGPVDMASVTGGLIGGPSGAQPDVNDSPAFQALTRNAADLKRSRR